MSQRYEIRLSGSGGQGLILAAIILAEAAGIHEGKYVTQTQSYGPEARGGRSRAEVVISDRPIHFPQPMGLDLLVAMTQFACDTYFIDLKPSGILIADPAAVRESPLPGTIFIPFTDIARHQIGLEQTANMVALGSMAEITQIVSLASLKKAVTARSPEGTAEINLKALSEGVLAARDLQKENNLMGAEQSSREPDTSVRWLHRVSSGGKNEL